jgi:hypothetical protein
MSNEKPHAKNTRKTCPKCSELIRDSTTTFCPKCGVNVHVPRAAFSSSNKKPVRKSSDGLLKVLLVLVGLALVVCFFSELRSCSSSTPRPPATARPDRGSEVDAYVMCKDFIRDNLVAPSTAEFARYTDVTAIKLENRDGEVYRVVGYVDSQNKFGAMIRVDYVCEIAYIGNDNWRLVRLDIEE